jgi:hypothetical protein
MRQSSKVFRRRDRAPALRGGTILSFRKYLVILFSVQGLPARGTGTLWKEEAKGAGKEEGFENAFPAMQGERMENLRFVIPWMKEAIGNLSASILEPDVWGFILAIFFLVILYSMVSSLKRLKREIASVSSELSAIRSTLRNIELSLGRIEESPLEGGEEEKDIWNLTFRLDNDKPERR